MKNARLKFQNIELPRITISVGIAEAPLHGSSASDLIRKADQALYRSKEGGRDRIEVAD